ncbi:dipeptidase [Agromyces archimandritae]|uniref:Dipeptidase n=1 Tax=Agromyces archimandritae TaxID=2781962 RepID=A0A975FNY5_9MICO|nr:dipeptidase [Agromyces archimandritae]QTX05910.1 dipeptidase [Agromyces archimandritae]
MTDAIPVFDGHNDLPWTARTERGYSVEGIDDTRLTVHTDIPKLRAGGVAAQFWSAYVHTDLSGPGVVTATLEQIDFIHRMAARYPEAFRIAATADAARAAIADGRIASMIGVEGGHQIDDSLAVLRSYARLGARYLTLTWNAHTSWADTAALPPEHGGLTGFGREVVAEMNRIGMLVDLAHVSTDTARDALDASTLPVIVSHSGAAALNPHPRNQPDDVIARVAAGGGVYMVAFVPSFLTVERYEWVLAGEDGPAPVVTIADVADHVDHVREVAGIDAVGLGADYDGTDAMPEGLGSVADYPALFDELRRRGWSDAELVKLGSGNVLRVIDASDGAYRAFLAEGAA